MSFSLAYALPSASLAAARKSLPAWKALGYRVVVLIDAAKYREYESLADISVPTHEYRGYPWAFSYLLRRGIHRECDIIIAGSDDIWPDRHDPQEIASELFRRFPDGFGVMQPTGDGHGCEEICGSPWIGSSLASRINQGKGPFWGEYNHYFCDRELKEVTERLGVLWQRSEITQHHEHWSWTTGMRPTHMEMHRQLHEHDKKVYLRRKSMDFPGHQPSPRTA